jgi:hypothetical protein
MMSHSQFDTAKLHMGTVDVGGPVTVDPPAVLEDVAFQFLIVQGSVQGSVVVKGEGRGQGSGAKGENGVVGRWSGHATAEPESLQTEVPTLALGLGVVAKKDPPGFETFTWSQQIVLQEA